MHTCLTWTRAERYVPFVSVITGAVTDVRAKAVLLTHRPLTLQVTCSQCQPGKTVLLMNPQVAHSLVKVIWEAILYRP